jgi:hypothetical protein
MLNPTKLSALAMSAKLPNSGVWPMSGGASMPASYQSSELAFVCSLAEGDLKSWLMASRRVGKTSAAQNNRLRGGIGLRTPRLTARVRSGHGR